MENLLPARIKNLIPFVFPPLLLALPFLILIHENQSPGRERSLELLAGQIKRADERARIEIQDSLIRAGQIFDSFRSGALKSADMIPREAVYRMKDGIIQDYTGEIYSFTTDSPPVSHWTLFQNVNETYFLYRFEEDLYYLRHFLNLQVNFITDNLKFPFAQKRLRFISMPEMEKPLFPSYSKDGRNIQARYPLAASQNRLQLELIIAGKDLESYFSHLRAFYIYSLFLVIFLYYFWLIRKRWKSKSTPVLALLMIPCLMLLSRIVSALISRNLFIKAFSIHFLHIHQILLLLACISVYMLLFLPRFFPRSPLILKVLLANGFMWLAVRTSTVLLNGVNFAFSEFAFNANYLMLLLSLILLFSFPYIVAAWLHRPGSRVHISASLVLQAFLLILLVLHYSFPLLPMLFLSVFIVTSLFVEHPVKLGFLALPLIALAVSSTLSRYALEVKRDFISNDLKIIFSSQNTYAKLVAREIAIEINSQEIPFEEYFQPDRQGDLARAWNNSLAHKEMIPSGIFILSKSGKLIQEYAYRIPYISVAKDIRFPFWHVEDVTADLFGKKLNLAISTMSVEKNGEWLGDIMIQVMSSPQLILRNLDQTTIFTINSKIRDSNISYISLNKDSQIAENPSNIHVPELNRIVRAGGGWVHFSYMGRSYSGYTFHQSDNSILFFFPEPSWFKRMSDWIKVFFLVLLFYLFLQARSLRTFKWDTFINSFSSKIFLILILISFSTAAIFAAFSLNFHFPTLERELLQSIHEKGRVAQNIILNVISQKKTINQNDLFMLSRILDNTVTLYENGNKPPFSSDNRKIIESQIPLFLPSSILEYLEDNPLQFLLQRGADGVKLYSKVPPRYILLLDIPLDTAEQIRAKKYYIDFFITIFFFLLLIGIAAAVFFRNRIMAPITGLDRGMSEVRKGNLTPLDEIPKEIELKSLYSGFNSMIEGIQEQKKSVSELARMKTLIQFSRRLAHEIKNPLTPIKLSAEQILHTLKNKTENSEQIIDQSVRYIIEETDHLRSVSLGFLDMSKLEKLELRSFDIVDLIQQEISSLQSIYPHVKLITRFPDHPVQVTADPVKIKQAFFNIFNNAVEACEAVSVECETSNRTEGEIKAQRIGIELIERPEEIELIVTDTGGGMNSNELELALTENFSSKETGTGLGLVIVRRIMELHQGSLDIRSEEKHGTEVRLRFKKNVSKT